MNDLYVKIVKGESDYWEKLDLPKDNISLKYKSNIFGSIGEIQSSYSYTISLPKTTNNKRIFGMIDYPAIVDQKLILGNLLEMRYMKQYTEILGNAVGYIEDITEESFEICLLFGFYGDLHDWVDKGESLNELGDYSYSTGFNNELSKYPDNIDNLPNVFKPYYDVGITMDQATKEYIARQPAVRVSSIISLIEEKINCDFVFTDVVRKKIPYLAILLTSQKYIDYRSYISPMVSNCSLSINTSPVGLMRYAVSGINSHYEFQSVGGVFESKSMSGITRIKGLSISLFGNEYIVFPSVETTIFIPEKTRIYTVRLTEAKSTARDMASWAISFEESISPTINRLLFCVIDDDGEATVMEEYETGNKAEYGCRADTVGEVAGYPKNSYIIYPDKEENFYSRRYQVEAGKKYGFFYVINTNMAFSGYSTWWSEQRFVLTHDAGVRDIEYRYDKDNIGGIDIPMKGNLPDISQIDFMQAIFNMFGVFPIVNPTPQVNKQNGRKIIKVVSIDDILKNKVIKYINLGNGKKYAINDWTDKLITDPNTVNVTPGIYDYCRRNYLKYDSNEEIDADGYFDMPYTALEESDELVKLPFLPSDGEKIPMYTYGGGTDYSFQDFGARIMNIVKKYYAENNTYMNVCALTFSDYTDKTGNKTESLSFSNLIEMYYKRYIDVIRNMYKITVNVNLTAVDLKNIDFTYPVYFKQFGRYFGIVEIQANSDDNNCEVTLIRLPV